MKYYLGELKYRPIEKWICINRLIYANSFTEAEIKFFEFSRKIVPKQYHELMITKVLETL